MSGTHVCSCPAQRERGRGSGLQAFRAVNKGTERGWGGVEGLEGLGKGDCHRLVTGEGGGGERGAITTSACGVRYEARAEDAGG